MSNLPTLVCWMVLSSQQMRTGICSPLIPYGPNVPADTYVALSDDDETKVILDVPLLFYGTTYTEAWISSNGYITLEEDFTTDYEDYYNFQYSFPFNKALVSPLWDDWNPGHKQYFSGSLYHRQTTVDLESATALIKSVYPEHNTFEPTWALVVTWSEYAHLWKSTWGATFQAIITTNGTLSFAIFLYESITQGTTGIRSTVGVNAGDDINYSWLCISETLAVENLPRMKQTCDSDPGVFVFRIDSANPDQENYDCTHGVGDPTENYDCTHGVGDPTVSYHCQWADASKTILNVTAIEAMNSGGIMTWDTQKYEDGEDPNIDNNTCIVTGAGNITMLKFQVDPDALSQPCGVRVRGTDPTYLDITVRSYNGDKRFDVAGDMVFTFTCDTESALPAAVSLDVDYNDYNVTRLPKIKREVNLDVVAPNTDIVLTEVPMGRLIQLRLTYDNTYSNINPYGVYVIECKVSAGEAFNETVIKLLKDGCVVEDDPKQPLHMSRGFQQSSLSSAGLFVAHSGTMQAVNFVNENQLYFECYYNFCFFVATAPNLCTNSCPSTSRRKRSMSSLRKTDGKRVVSTSLRIINQEGTKSNQEDKKSCTSRSIVYPTTAALICLNIVVTIISCVLFWRILHIKKARK